MSDLAIALLSFPVLLLLVFLRVPIAAAMAVVGFGGLWVVLGKPVVPLSQLKSLSYDTFASYTLTIVPLFLLMGQFATRAGLSRLLFEAASHWLGHRKGGLAMAAVGACGAFGAICGSSLATASTMGQVALPELKRRGYSDAMATGALAAGGTLGILIPPSIILVIYAILTEQNIIKMFVAALIPGIMAALGYMIAIGIMSRKPGQAGEVEPRMPYLERFRAIAKTWPVFLIFGSVLGGIYMGIFTPTEAAAIGAALTGIYAVIWGNCTWRDVFDCFLETGKTTGMIFLIILGAAIFNSFLAFTRAPMEIAAWVSDLGIAPMLVLVAILLVYLLFGCVMDSLSMILLTIPVFFPIISALDFGMTPEETAIWFGILVLIVVEVGLITPPVGLNLFVINALAKGVPISRTYSGVLPFVTSDLIRVVILVAAPWITLGLVRLLF